jgi:hypothetical protein
VDQEEEYPTHEDVPDEFNGLIDESNEYCNSMKKDSYRKTIENGIKWMSEECFLAFTKSVENFHYEVCQSSLFVLFLYNLIIMIMIVSLWFVGHRAQIW